MSSTVMRHDFQVVSEAQYVPLARRETAKVLTDWGMFEDVVDTACLIISELVANVVRHATVLSPTAAVTLAVEEQAALVLAVADAHPLKPKPLPAAHDLGGRGLLLVDAPVREVHGRAEVLPETTTGGKRIIIRLPLAPVAA
ncbi:ATP-binding protein [Streptomyces actinomycinicus]|uniref:ATP-binding protein n=1 Tax=Streptomyces actinomycinicus TaxID=1695166 RepID=A0A937ER07_9ACTN|nr:ATP-binding protein [Streptomyces actinomycinicus]MBL1087546.1 ATP-binding protein [Streptomyces actinomycinicus]